MSSTRRQSAGFLRLATLFIGMGLVYGCGDSPDLIQPPSSLTYAITPAYYMVGTAITPNEPTCVYDKRAPVTYSVSPALPAGLSLDASTGVISGTPTTVAPVATYTVTAKNALGSVKTDLSITVTVQAPPDTLVYSVNPVVYLIGTAIASNVPSNGGGAVASYSVLPALPAGLSLNTATGVISGTPTIASSAASYLVTGTNALGNTTCSLSITVHSAPAITAQPTDQSVYIGMTATFSVTVSSTALLSYQWYRNGVTIGGATSATYSTPTVTQSDSGTSYSVIVSGCCGSSVASNTATLLVKVWSGFSYTGSMSIARLGQSATLLPGGKVLIAGGYGGSTYGLLASSELYDPAAGTFSSTGNMNTARNWHTATLLPSGKVLIAGGANSGGALVNSELYDPETGVFSATGNMNAARSSHTATLLSNGKVLIAGGNSNSVLAGAELYDPAAGSFSNTGSMNTARFGHVATLLPTGKVLVAGGNSGPSSLASAELYDQDAMSFSSTGSMSVARSTLSGTLLPNGKVLVAGQSSSAELYDPAARSFSDTGSMSTSRGDHSATLLPNGMVLVASGCYSGYLSGAELYNSTTGNFTLTGNVNTPRRYHTATLLLDGRVLVTGGDAGGTLFSSAELYQ